MGPFTRCTRFLPAYPSSVMVCLALLASLPPTCTAETNSPPYIIREPSADELLFQVAADADERDKPFMLVCEASGNPVPMYKWFKNGHEYDFQLHDDIRVLQRPGQGTVTVTHPRPEDEGLYHCEATNEYGTAVSNAVFVRQSELQSFPETVPKKVVVEEGNPVTLTCSPPTSYPKLQILWVVQSSDGNLKAVNSSRITVDPDGALHFSNVTATDGHLDAHYACSASNVFRKEYKLGNRVKLSVLRADGAEVQSKRPLLKQYCSPPNIVSHRGKAQDLHCIFGGTPLPEVRWSKNNGGGLDSRRYTFLNYGKTLRIKTVDFQDEGTYECTASNGVGSDLSCSSSIVVQSVPYWTSVPSNTNAAVGTNVRFTCEASGMPEPSIAWLVNGVELSKAPENPRRKLASPTVMTLDGVLKSDTAVYQCNASNALGYTLNNFYLDVCQVTVTNPFDQFLQAVLNFRNFLHGL